MVPRVMESQDFVRSNSAADEGKHSLLDGRDLSRSTSVKEIAKPSMLIRILMTFGFIKAIIRNTRPERLMDDKEEVKCKQKLICDEYPKSTLHQELSRSEESCNVDECKGSELDYGTFVEFSDLEPQENMALQIKEIVAKSPDCGCTRISDFVALMIARDILELAENEPCGLQGCKVLLSLDDRMGQVGLGDFKPKDGFLCTFEVNVVLHLKRSAIRYLLPFIACMPQTNIVSDKYSITKQKLYTCNGSRGSTPVHWHT